ncbi:hypothetical protein AwDysgo_15000 [Bacteroidales bacterium]|nr:hypothetical protein AwDysgo_15000 [Bacteroidales bacterium]
MLNGVKRETLKEWGLIFMGLLTFVTLIALEFLYHFNKSKQRKVEFERLRIDNLNMQYQQLKGQINPHFSFNSLNALVSLINRDTERAAKYTKKTVGGISLCDKP